MSIDSAVFNQNQHEPGVKLDTGKVKPALVLEGFAHALLAVSDVGTYGANKYSDNNWKVVSDAKCRYTNAMYRHLLQEATGELRDNESNLLHAAHAAWNALARLEFIIAEHKEREIKVATRYPHQRMSCAQTQLQDYPHQ